MLALEASNTDITAELHSSTRAQQAFNGSAKMMQADADVTRRLMDTQQGYLSGISMKYR